MNGYQHDDDGNITICTENLLQIVIEDMVAMTDAERLAIFKRLAEDYCPHCGTRCLPCSCQAFWMEH